MFRYGIRLLLLVVGTFEQGLGTSPAGCPPVECGQLGSGAQYFKRGDTWRASRDRTLRSSVRSARVQCSEEPNGSIRGGCLFKPHGRLKLTLLTICIDIATL